MSDSLEKYLETSTCSHCFNIDSECSKCVEKLLAEHDAKVIAFAIDECKKIVMADCVTNCEYVSLPDCIECMCRQFEELKEKKNG